VPLVESEAEEEAHVCLKCMPVQLYQELFILPWIFMDTGWEFVNYRWIVTDQILLGIVAFSTTAGVVSVLMLADNVRRALRGARPRSEVAVLAAELLWVTGNIVWMLEDVLTDSGWYPAWCVAVGLFVVGNLFTVRAFVCSLREAPEAHAQRGAAEPDPEAASPQVAAREALPLPAPEPACSGAGAKSKFKSRRRSRRRARSLLEDVAILPKDWFRPEAGSGGASQADVQLVAEEALRALGWGLARPLVLVDLGHAASGLRCWRALLPRVRPYYAVRSSADKKILQLLREGNCGFACTTASEIGLALAAGATPEDLVLSEPCKPRSHISYARQRGVRWMSFDDAAELRKIAAEHRGSRLLLRLACGFPEAEPHGLMVSFGAEREDWPPLLDLARQLGLEVAGISLHGCHERGALGPALAVAREALELLVGRGFAPELLDLGGGPAEAAASGAGLEEVAGAVQEALAQCFPLEAWQGLRVVADAGQLLGPGSSTLLTRVVGKAEAPADAGGRAGAAELLYTLNDGIYGTFSSALCNHAQPAPEPLRARGGPPRPCSLLGPTGDSLDVVLRGAVLPELEVGDCLVWRGVGAPAVASWHYAEEGILQDDIEDAAADGRALCRVQEAEDEAHFSDAEARGRHARLSRG